MESRTGFLLIGVSPSLVFVLAIGYHMPLLAIGNYHFERI